MSSKVESFIENCVIPEILQQLKNEDLIAYKWENPQSLDGFMSCLYIIELKTKTEQGVKKRLLMAKFMRGDHQFRVTSNAYIQFANEIYTYSTILPQYEKFLRELKVTSINIRNLVAPCYIAKFGYIEGLSSGVYEKDACLVLENLKPLGYQMGPRLVLRKEELLAMCRSLGQYHALSYALKALRPFEFEELKSGIITFPFLNDNDPQANRKSGYTILHRHGFDRFYAYYERLEKSNYFDKNSPKDLKLMKDLRNLKRKYFENPTRLKENLRIKINDRLEDQKFAVILHGDYNRNNVLFKYSQTPTNREISVENVRLIDFQQLRYASPAFDISFFMYLNTDQEERSTLWPVLLKTYHDSMFSALSTILKASQKSLEEIENILLDYSFENFEKHFSRFAFYGVVICLHFLHWMMCSEIECSEISYQFANHIHSEEFRRLSLEVGGDEVNMLLLEMVRHASELGYMEDL